MNKYWQLIVGIVKMLVRDRMSLAGSFGVAFVSMFLFGWLFGSEDASRFNIGLVDEDRSVAVLGITETMKKSDALVVKTGDREAELDSLRRGGRRAVIIFEQGFERNLAAGNAVVKVVYDQGNPTAAAITNSAVQAIIGGVNRTITRTTEPITIEQQGVTAARLRNIDYLAPGLLGMLIMWANMFVGSGLIAWRERGILKRLGATALRPFELVGAQVVAHMLFSLIQAALLMAIAILVFNVVIQGSIVLLAMAVVIGILSMLSVGYVIGSFVKTSEGASSVSMLISFPMMFLGGSYFPTDGAPDFLQPAIKAMPLTYLNHTLREIVNNASGLAIIQNDLLVLIAWMVGCMIVAVKLFRWQ